MKSEKQLYDRAMDPWPTTLVNALCLLIIYQIDDHDFTKYDDWDRGAVWAPQHKEHEFNVDMFLNGDIFSQNLLLVFPFRNMSTFNSCSCTDSSHLRVDRYRYLFVLQQESGWIGGNVRWMRWRVAHLLPSLEIPFQQKGDESNTKRWWIVYLRRLLSSEIR